MSVQLDAADLRILEVLQADGTLNPGQVSERVNMSSTACWRRIKRLEESGYILRRVAVLDPDRLGLRIAAFVTIRLADLSGRASSDAEDLLETLDSVTEIYRTSGELGYVLRVVAADMAAFDTLLSKIQAGLQLRSVETVFVTRSVRNRIGLPLSILRGATPNRTRTS